jgi:hypothetical protein
MVTTHFRLLGNADSPGKLYGCGYSECLKLGSFQKDNGEARGKSILQGGDKPFAAIPATTGCDRHRRAGIGSGVLNGLFGECHRVPLA